jgi:carbon monoxide dehydrogenase subunit G
MKISQKFQVNQAPPLVWDALADVALVAECLPGAELTEANDGRTYKGTMKIKVGPITASFAGKAIVERDEQNFSGTVEGSGADSGSSSRAKATMRYALTPLEGGMVTEVAIEADIVLSGSLAQFGRSDIINDISARLTDAFVSNLQTRLAAGAEGSETVPSPKEIDAISLVVFVLWKRFLRFLGRLRG